MFSKLGLRLATKFSAIKPKTIGVNVAELKYAPQIREQYPLSQDFSNYRREIIKHLKTDEPREHLIITESKTGKRIHTETCGYDGGGENVDIKKLTPTAIFWHGHPTVFNDKGLKTTVLSQSDLETLLSFPSKKMLAFNEVGEHVSIEKLPNYVDKSWQDVDRILKIFETKIFDKMREIVPEQEITEFIKTKPWYSRSRAEAAVFERKIDTPEGTRIVANVYKEVCPHLNLKFETNYSGLEV